MRDFALENNLQSLKINGNKVEWKLPISIAKQTGGFGPWTQYDTWRIPILVGAATCIEDSCAARK
jgi:hypothetical protein